MLTKFRTFSPNFWSSMKIKCFYHRYPDSSNHHIIPIHWFVNVFEMKRVMYVNALDIPPYQLIIPKLNWNKFQTHCLNLQISYHHKSFRKFWKLVVYISWNLNVKTLQGNVSYRNWGYWKLKSKFICVFPYGLQPGICGLANQEILPNFLHFSLDSVLYG